MTMWTKISYLGDIMNSGRECKADITCGTWLGCEKLAMPGNASLKRIFVEVQWSGIQKLSDISNAPWKLSIVLGSEADMDSAEIKKSHGRSDV